MRQDVNTGDRTCTQETGRAHRRQDRRQDVHTGDRTGDRTCTQETGRAHRRQDVQKVVTSCVVSVTLSVHEGSHFMSCQCHLVSP